MGWDGSELRSVECRLESVVRLFQTVDCRLTLFQTRQIISNRSFESI
jgi:hypothetical protein